MKQRQDQKFFGLSFARIALGQSLPPGSYNINGTVTSISGASCPLSPKLPATGVIYYPGPGQDTTQILLASVVPQKSVAVAIMSAFPPVPANGLNGWSASNTVSPNYNQYRNGKLTGGGTAAILSFDLMQIQGDLLASAQGTMVIDVDSIAPCKETVQLILEKVSPFKKMPMTRLGWAEPVLTAEQIAAPAHKLLSIVASNGIKLTGSGK